MAENEISAALAGQQGATAAEPVQQQTANQQAQPQGNYVTSEQLKSAMDELKRTIQSSTDKSYNRVQKMIANMQKAGIQNPTYEQAQAMLQMQEQSGQQDTERGEAQPSRSSAVSQEAEQWIRSVGGDPSQGSWSDVYDAWQEAGVPMITREDPEYAQYFEQDGKPKNFDKPRHFVRAFEQAFAAKKARLAAQPAQQQDQAPATGNLASSPALGAGGQKSSFIDPKSTSANKLISDGLRGI